MPKQQNIADSFEKLFQNNYAKLCHFAMQFLKDNDAAKDIVQETFVTYWNNKEELDTDGIPASGFLYASVRNACLNKIRRQKLEHGYLNQQEHEPTEDAIALNAMIRSEIISELNKTICTLPENCQRVFRMGYLEGLKNPQIALTLGISVNTVKTQKKRGLELIKMRLSPDFFTVLVVSYFFLY